MAGRRSHRPTRTQPQLIELRYPLLTCELTMHVEGVSDSIECWSTIHEPGRPEQMLACWSWTIADSREPAQVIEGTLDLLKRTREMLDPF